MTQPNTVERVMTVAEARQVQWMRPNQRPMGELLDEGCLTKKDLEWAAQCAFKAVQKQAARVLLDELDRIPIRPIDKATVQPLPPELAHSAFPINLTME